MGHSDLDNRVDALEDLFDIINNCNASLIIGEVDGKKDGDVDAAYKIHIYDSYIE